MSLTRRDFLAVTVAGVWAPPRAAAAQRATAPYRIGWLGPTSPTPETARVHDAFRRGLRELGHVEGRDYVIELRWAHGRAERLPELATELVRLPVDVIVAVTSHVAHAAKLASATTAILLISPDPLSTGLVTNLARPGGNITGVTMFPGPEIAGKYLELVKEALPAALRVAVLWSEASPWQPVMIRAAEEAGRDLRVHVQPVGFRGADEFETAFSAIVRDRAHAVIVLPDAITFVQRKQISALALRHRLPALLTHLDAAADGALMAFGTNMEDLFRRAASYADRMMKGTKPGDLPVEQPTTFSLAINLRTASALRLTIPRSLLLRADKVIE